MGKCKSERERKLQRKLIPLNLIVCILALVAAITLFITPIIKADVGKILHDEGLMGFVDEKIDDIVGDTVSGTDQENIDYKPVVEMLVKQVMGKAEGEIAISGLSAFRVLTGSGDKTEMVMNDLFFGDDALATRLINSVVDGVADIFETDEGKALLEEAVVSAMTKGIVDAADDETIANALTDENVKELVSILRDLSDSEKVPDGNVDEVAGRFVDKVDEILGDEIVIDGQDRADIISEVQKLYDDTVENLQDGEVVSIEAIICVSLSQNVDLSKINIEDLFGGILDGSEENSVHRNTAEDEAGGDVQDGPDGGTQEDGADTDTQENGKIVTNYGDLLLEIGFDKEKKEDLKGKLRTNLTDQLNSFIRENGIDEYLGYYEYLTYVMLVFMAPWIILFLFSFFHMLAKNKRFTMWYVKLFGWIPALIWLVLTLFPVAAPALASKISFINEIWNGENSAVVKAVLSGISSLTWISGLCYVLLWLVSIFWAFPIKHKIRKERKNPEVVDADDEDDDY